MQGDVGGEKGVKDEGHKEGADYRLTNGMSMRTPTDQHLSGLSR